MTYTKCMTPEQRMALSDWTRSLWREETNTGAVKAPDIKLPDFPSFIAPQKYTPKRVIHNPNAVIVFWQDGTKTIVRRREGDKDDIYSAFAQALVKKLFKGTTTAHKMVSRVLEEQTPKKKG